MQNTEYWQQPADYGPWCIVSGCFVTGGTPNPYQTLTQKYPSDVDLAQYLLSLTIPSSSTRWIEFCASKLFVIVTEYNSYSIENLGLHPETLTFHITIFSIPLCTARVGLNKSTP